MDIDCSKGSHGKPHHIASGTSPFNRVVNKQSFVSTFHRCSALEFILESFGMTWNRWKHSRVIVGFYINDFAIGAIGTQTILRRFLAMASQRRQSRS